MATRTGYPGTESAGDVLTAANFTKLPGGLIAYVDVTSAQTGISATADLTSLTLTWTAGTSRTYLITGQVPFVQRTGAGDVALLITDGSNTQIDAAGFPQLGINKAAELIVTAKIQPSAGSVTYKLRANTSGSTVDTNASATQPARLWVIDVGPSF